MKNVLEALESQTQGLRPLSVPLELKQIERHEHGRGGHLILGAHAEPFKATH